MTTIADINFLLFVFPGIQKAWNTYYDQKGNDDKSSLVSSLVSGKLVVPEKTHPRIKNVAGAHPAGSALITFNAAAFCSHGAVQNENAPMSKREAYEYTTALNTLLADESRVQRIGNDTVISWACCGNAVYSDLFDRSAARGNMAVRKLYVFKHSSALGDAPSWKLFDSINVHKRDGADVARNFSDYEVQVNREAIPDSVSVSEMVDHTL